MRTNIHVCRYIHTCMYFWMHIHHVYMMSAKVYVGMYMCFHTQWQLLTTNRIGRRHPSSRGTFSRRFWGGSTAEGAPWNAAQPSSCISEIKVHIHNISTPYWIFLWGIVFCLHPGPLRKNWPIIFQSCIHYDRKPGNRQANMRGHCGHQRPFSHWTPHHVEFEPTARQLTAQE